MNCSARLMEASCRGSEKGEDVMGTHLEYITDRKFNSSFKNMLRDYYTRGFKESWQVAASSDARTYKNDRKRLEDFLGDYLTWSDSSDELVDEEKKAGKWKEKNLSFRTRDSISMRMNPFHRVFRFCGTNRSDYLYCFFHTVVALERKFQIRGGIETFIETLGIEWDEVDRFRDKYEAKCRKLKTTELRRYFFSEETADNKTANNRLQQLKNIGVICCEQSGGERPFSDEQIEMIMNAIQKPVQALSNGESMAGKIRKSLRNYTRRSAGDRNWYLSKLTLNRLLEAGEAVNIESLSADTYDGEKGKRAYETEENSFKEHFCYALDFYSRTYLFGEIGTYLLDRLKIKYDSPIRLKHEYYMHALYDFNAIDLMTAIEEKQWCLISYKRNEHESKILCYPIELRVSATNGREYLMYYEPFKKSCASLRVEFIESIHYYPDHHVKRVLAECWQDKKNNTEEEIVHNINRAKVLMRYTWGVSTGKEIEGNVERIDQILRKVCVRIAYNPEKEGFILNRLYKESRNGLLSVDDEGGYIDFTAIVADVNEMIPFIRSFYGRIISCSGLEEEGFSIEKDIEEIAKQSGGEELNNTNTEQNPRRIRWGIEEEILEKLGMGKPADAHDKLFNEVFSTRYHIFAAILSELCSGEDVSYTDKEIRSICKRIVYQYKDKCGSEMIWKSFKDGKVFADFLIEGGFLAKEDGKDSGYRRKYEMNSQLDLYKDVIPLSEVEVRWLKSIIEDEKIHYFLSEKEIMALRVFLADTATDIKPFPMDVVHYYDRYKLSSKQEWKEGAVLNSIFDAICMNRVVKVKYVSKQKKLKSGAYKPILVEYSKRDNCFQVYFLSCRKKEGIRICNLAQCISVEMEETAFDPNETQTYFEEYIEKQKGKVEIEFNDRQGLAERILTEVAPWEKQCKFDPESGVYHLTIHYQRQNGKQLELRILQHGRNVRIVNGKNESEHVIAKAIRKKLEKQNQILNQKAERLP